MRRIVRSRPSPSLVISLLALFIALGGSAYALSRGEVKTRNIAKGAVTKAKLHSGAVTAKKVGDFSLRLHNLGGKINHGTATIGSPDTVPANGCVRELMNLFNPAPRNLVGSLVTGYVSDHRGHAVLDNTGIVVPTNVSKTTQGGAEANLLVCNADGGTETIPAGSVFHYQVIGP